MLKEYTNSQIEHLIDEHIHSKRDRDILKMYFIDGISVDKISSQEGIDLSPRWVYTIIERAMMILSRHL